MSGPSLIPEKRLAPFGGSAEINFVSAIALRVRDTGKSKN
jgi:hypothetical protein